MQLVFSDAQFWRNFLPLSFTRPIAGMYCGMMSFAERWQRLLGISTVAYLTEDYLQEKFPKPAPVDSLLLVPNFLPTERLLAQIKNLQPGEALVFENELIAVRLDMADFSLNHISKMTDIEEGIQLFRRHTDLFSLNEATIDFDFKLLAHGRESQDLSPTNGFLGDVEDLFIEEGAQVEFATLNCRTGKIYIGKDAEIMEGCHLRGPIALGEGSKFNLGAKIYGATSIGPHCKMGGELNNVVVFGYSNKGHEGFVGNSVIGEWCNLGADTNTSNLKNNYASVKLWDFGTENMADTGLQFCGSIMGDHAKTAINTQLNTGTVVGVAANIFKPGFPPNHVENFSWGGQTGDEKFRLDKAFDVAEKVMARRRTELSEADRRILEHIYNNEI